MKKVMVDPGHGGTDRANKGPTGYVEADGVLKISKYLRDELLSTGAFEVKLTRETDTFVGVRDRGTMAAKWGADLAISEHTNATGKPPNTTVRGTEVYESVDLPDDALADKMSAAVSKALGIPDRGGKSWESTTYPGEDYLGFIDAAQDGGCKHVLLVESAYHDNAKDEALLKQDDMLKKIAVAQAKVICELFGVTYPPLPKGKPIMGVQEATADQLYAYAFRSNPKPKISVPLYDLCKMFIEEGAMEGVRGDIAFCQSCKETAFFAFNGLARPEWNNYSGLGVTGQIGTDGVPVGNKFKDARTGVRAQIQHLKAYGSTLPLNQTCVDARFSGVKRGRAPYWEWLGRDENPENASRAEGDRQGWAVPGTTYGHDIIGMFEKVLTFPKSDPTIPKYPVPTIHVIYLGGTVKLGEPSLVQAEGTKCSSISLYVDGACVNTQTGEEYKFAYVPTAPGTYKMELKVKGLGDGKAVSSGEFDLLVIKEEPPVPEPTKDTEEKLNVGLINKVFEMLFTWLSKLLGKK